MQVILIISTFWKANTTILKLHTLWTFNRVFRDLLLSVYVKVKGLLKKEITPNLSRYHIYL